MQRWLQKFRHGLNRPSQSWTSIQLATSLQENYANTLDCKRFLDISTWKQQLVLKCMARHRNAYRSTSAEKRELDRCMDTIVQEQREAAEVHRTVREYWFHIFILVCLIIPPSGAEVLGQHCQARWKTAQIPDVFAPFPLGHTKNSLFEHGLTGFSWVVPFQGSSWLISARSLKTRWSHDSVGQLHLLRFLLRF